MAPAYLPSAYTSFQAAPPASSRVPTRHHPPEDWLLDYASGLLWEAPSLVIATHLALCPNCRQQVVYYEFLGGWLLEQENEAPLADTTLPALLAQIDTLSPATPPARARRAACMDGSGIGASPHMMPIREENIDPACILPHPLRPLVQAAQADGRSWSTPKNLPGLSRLSLPTAGPGTAYLICLCPGIRVPEHHHDNGLELTIVLAGSFHDPRGTFYRGDVAIDDASLVHSPIAGSECGCLCLSVSMPPSQNDAMLFATESRV